MNLPSLFLAMTGREFGFIFGLSGLAIGTVFGIYGMYLQHRRRTHWQEIIRLALDKGQPIPTLPENNEGHGGHENSGPAHDLRAGLILAGVGAGLYYFFDAFLGESMRYIAAIPGFIGVALFLHGLLALMFRRKDNAEHPPRA